MLIENNYKTILTATGLLITAVVAAFLFEGYYRQFVLFLFKFFNGDKIQFLGKNFHLFPSNSFVIAFVLFTLFTFSLLKLSPKPNQLKRTCTTVFVFFTATILITALDSQRLIVECTACNDGIRRVTYNQVTYDKYFIMSLTTTSAYLLTAYLLERKRLKKRK